MDSKTCLHEEQMEELVFSSDNRRSMELPRLSSNGQSVDRLSPGRGAKFVLHDLNGDDQSQGGDIPGFQLHAGMSFLIVIRPAELDRTVSRG